MGNWENDKLESIGKMKKWRNSKNNVHANRAGVVTDFFLPYCTTSGG